MRPQPNNSTTANNADTSRNATQSQHGAYMRPPPRSANQTTTVNNTGTFHRANLSHINQGNYGTVNQGNTYRAEMFKGASNFEIRGGEFNNVGRDMNKMICALLFNMISFPGV